jgi:signal transduction histidine kinase/CheY-like chemotaxis protein
MKPDHHRSESAPSCSNADSDPATTAFFQSIVTEADEGIIVLGAEGRVSYANPAAEFLLGHGREELTGEMFGLPRSRMEQTIRVNVISQDGRVRLAELRVEPLPTGPSGSLLLRLKDITAFDHDAAAAREQVRRRDEFLAMLSHEIRNPLSAIRSAAVLLARDDVRGETRRSAADIVDRQFRHLERILDDLLDITRISQGKLEILRDRVDVNQVVRDALEEASPLIVRKEHTLQVDLPQQPAWVVGDATRLEQVVVNLVNNAAKFTPPKGHLSVSVAAESSWVRIQVCDDGPGIAESIRPHIFEPFVQAQQTIARSEGGLGIGLALVHTIVMLHEGSIRVEPNPEGRGARFVVELPASAPVDQRADGPETDLPRPLRILVIEDGDDCRSLLKQILELEGYEVIEARDGPGGLAAVLDQRPDVALVDIGLPDLSGYELARRVRQDARGQQVRLIAVTGYGMPRDVQEVRQAGFDGHLVKPLRYPELLKLLRRGAEGCPGGDGR